MTKRVIILPLELNARCYLCAMASRVHVAILQNASFESIAVSSYAQQFNSALFI